MADKIQIRAGNKSGMPTLTDRELAYVRNEKALYVGTPTGNEKLCSGATEGKVATLEQTVATQQTALNSKLTASPVAAQAGVAADADLATAVAALNALIAAMKSSGVMNT